MTAETAFNGEDEFESEFESEAEWVHYRFPPSEKSALFLYQKLKILAKKITLQPGDPMIIPFVSFSRAAGLRTRVSRERGKSYLEETNLFSVKEGAGSYVVFTPTPLTYKWMMDQI